MRTFKIVMEISVKDKSLNYDDWIYRAIEEQLERKEQILEYDIEEVLE